MNKTSETDLAIIKATGATVEQIEEYRLKMLFYLKEHPFNYSGAARTIGQSREAAYAMIRLDVAPFKDLENQSLDALEEKIYKFAMGQLSEEDTFHAPTAKDILNRYRWKRRWLDETKQAKKEPASDQPAVPAREESARLLSDYETRAQQPTTSVLLPGQGRRIQ